MVTSLRREFECSTLSRLVVEETVAELLSQRLQRPDAGAKDQPHAVQEEMFTALVRGIAGRAGAKDSAAAAKAPQAVFHATVSVNWCGDKFVLPIFIGLASYLAGKAGLLDGEHRLFRFAVSRGPGMFGLVFEKAVLITEEHKRRATAMAYAQTLATAVRLVLRAPDQAALGYASACEMAGIKPRL